MRDFQGRRGHPRARTIQTGAVAACTLALLAAVPAAGVAASSVIAGNARIPARVDRARKDARKPFVSLILSPS